MHLIQIVKYNKTMYYEDENRMTPCSTWIEVNDKELHRLEDAISKANRLSKSVYNYAIIYQINESDFSEIFESAAAFMKEVEQREAKEQARLEKYEHEKEEKARQRKLKQLEKLKKEFGE